MRKAVLGGIVALGLAPGIAGAVVEKDDFQLNTTQDLVDICSATEQDAMAQQAINFCLGYIEGAAHYHDHISNSKDMGRIYCAPPNTSVTQGRLMFVSWAQKNSGNAKAMKSSPLEGLMIAAGEIWPCPKN